MELLSVHDHFDGKKFNKYLLSILKLIFAFCSNLDARLTSEQNSQTKVCVKSYNL